MKEFILTFYKDVYIIIIYTIILLAISIWKFRKNTEKNNIFTCENLFIMFYYIFLAIGPIYLVLAKEYTYNYNVFFVLLMGLICFIIGADFITKIKIKKKDKETEKKNKDLKQINFKSVLKVTNILLIISYVSIIIYLGKNIGFILQDFENNRVLAMQGSGVFIHLGYMMLPTTWILYYCHLNYQKSKKIYIIYLIDIVFLLFVGFRSRILELLLVSIIIKNYHKPFKIKKLFVYGIILILIVSALQIARAYISGGNLIPGIDSLVNTMAVNSINLKSIFRVFPKNVPFQYGYTYLLSFMMLLPGPNMDATLWLKQALNLSFDGGGVTPSIIGEFFINFGYIGIFIGMLLLGIVCRLIDNYGKKTQNNKIIYFIVSFYIARSVSSGLSNFIILTLWFTAVSFFIFHFKEIGKYIEIINKIFMRIFSKTIMKYIKTKDTVLIANGLNCFDGCPKDIFLEAQKYENIKDKYYWITKDKKMFKKLKKTYSNILYSYSIKGFIYIIRSKYYILNVNTQDFYPGLKIPNNRIIIQTFHGFPTKSFCKSASEFYTQKDIQMQIEDSFNPNNMYIITAGKYEDEAFHNNCDFPYDRMLKIGHPRNDRLKEHEKIRLDNKWKIVTDNSTKIVCYCPTWRENGNFKLFPFSDSNLEEFNKVLQENNILLIVKLHPLYGKMDQKLGDYSNICLYSYEWNLDNVELFSIIDLLITDYSSIYCDYLLTNKPVAFIQYDYEEYIKTRPLSTEREILFPGPYINSFYEFKEEILKLLNDKEYYKEEREKALKLFYEYYEFDAGKKVVEFIEKKRD